ncbi:MAG: YaiO family outer membrane beta-barrel protein [Acidobacteriota bacterium]
MVRQLYPFFKMLAIIICLAIPVFSQAESLDDLYAKARDLAFDGKRQEAKTLCATILERNPNYHDARLLLGRLHLWDWEYESARAELTRVVTLKPAYADARDALIDVELWSEHNQEALQLCEAGLQLDANNKIFYYKKAKALKYLKREKEAIESVKIALQLEPEYREARILLKDLQESQKAYWVKAEYSYDYFDKNLDPWQQLSVSVSRQTKIGSMIGRVNHAKRFNDHATQFEIDSYPRLRQGTTAYWNVGVSSSYAFPKFRFGAEVYQKLSDGFDSSIGVRYLHFTGANIMIYTGSIGKYHGNYLFQFHPFITPSSIGSSVSGNFSVRRYLENADNYFTVSVGLGSSPDERYNALELIRLKSQKLGVDWRKAVGAGLIVEGYFGLSNQQLKYGESRRNYTFSFAMAKRF